MTSYSPIGWLVKADVERIVSEMCSVQEREQTVDDPALSTRGAHRPPASG
ncbi:MAG: hypothetical protein ACFFBD_28290 [Candidatus Hodarchaeota archaeon]